MAVLTTIFFIVMTVGIVNVVLEVLTAPRDEE